MYVLEIIYPCIYVIVHAKMQAVTGGRPFQFVIFRSWKKSNLSTVDVKSSLIY